MALSLSAASPPDTFPRVPLHRFVHIAGGAAVVVAASALMGWVFDVDVLKSVIPGHQQMKANTAICLIACGLALLSTRSDRAFGRRGSRVLSAGVFLLGAATLVEYATGVDLGIDTLLFADPQALVQGRPPGRMSQISALAFVLLGSLGIVSRDGARVWLYQGLALAVVAIGLFALSAYGYAMGMGSREAPFNPISVHTAVLLLMLGLGWLVAQPEAGLMRVLSAQSFGGELARRTLLPALLIPALLAYAAQWLRRGELLSDGAIITLLAVSSGVAVAAMIWWASALLDRVETHRRVARHLRDSANTDALTGLGNRRAFDAALKRLLAAHAGGGPVFSLLLIDLDHFKAYNDSFGHPAGDEALRQAGLLLGLALRPGDVACRYGGEEFAVLLPGADAVGAMRVAERIVQDVRGGLWLHRPVTTSIGATTVRTGDDGNRVVARADAALYDAKRAGRDRALFHAED
jgi:diguanylate cyclase (GGDEF)-like protein